MQPKWDDHDRDSESESESESDEDDVADDDDSDKRKPRGKQARLDQKFVTLDGKVFPLQQFHSSSVLARSCFSNKTKTSGLQTLAWAMPSGLPFLVTGLFAAKLSEKRQVALHSQWLGAIPQNVCILEDRGFRSLQRHYPK